MKRLFDKRLIKTIITAVLFLSAGKLLHTAHDCIRAQKAYAVISADYTQNSEASPLSTESSDIHNAHCFPVEIQFDELKEVCSDIAGWLYCDGTVLNYPVVRTDDNDYYLNRGIYGDYQLCGAIYIDYRCAGDFSGRNTLVYGHNMRDGSMLAFICEYKKAGYYNDHPVILLSTPKADYRLEVFSGHVVEYTSEYYCVDFPDDDSFEHYIQSATELSDFKAGIEVNASDRIVTFSTCSYEYNGARYLLHAKISEMKAK